MIALRAWLVLLCAVPLLLRAAGAVQLAWRTTQGYELVSLDRQRVLERRPLPADLRLRWAACGNFVFAWLSDTGQAEPPYTCQGQPRGGLLLRQTIGRDRALVRSCGLYFEPQRLACGRRPARLLAGAPGTGLVARSGTAATADAGAG